MKVVFIAGPYRANSDSLLVRNIRNAENAAKNFWTKGYAVICPHLNSILFSGICREENFLAGYEEILSRCDIVYFLVGWEYSEGARAEHELAKKLGKTIIYEEKNEVQGSCQ